MRLAKPHMVGGPLIAEGRGYCIVDREVRSIGKGYVELPFRIRPFLRSMQHGDEVGGGQMTATVRSVGCRAYRGGIGRPHAGSRPGGSQQGARSGIADRQLVEQCVVRAGQGKEETLRQAERHIGTHLRQSLKGGSAGYEVSPA